MDLTTQEFYQKVQSSFGHVLMYENITLQEKARSIIPCEELKKRAEAKMKESHLGENHFEDLILIELLDWFKNSFFHWFNEPVCDICQRPTKSRGMADPSAEDISFGASRVEKYECEVCRAIYRFPRYNNPGKLLDTRVGRCGEWANCFTLCCRALGYDARYVLDWTDHVWTEVYSENQKRWLHCDPCENTCDKPLLYECGWGKKLTYVIAFAKDDIQDVTWRYSAKHAEVLQRRNLVSEKWLVTLIMMLRSERNSQRKRFLEERNVAELVEMLTPRSSTEEELVGRQTGTLEWRTARGELGKNNQLAEHVIEPTETELAQKCIQLKYMCSDDFYMRGDEKVSAWMSLVFKSKNIMRKVEYDWNMVYLARVERSDCATISWKIDLSSCGLLVDKVEVEVHSTCFETGKINWELRGNERSICLTSGKRQTVTDLNGSKSLLLTAELRDGEGPEAWQHTQLFRQKRSADDQLWPLNLTVHLQK